MIVSDTASEGTVSIRLATASNSLEQLQTTLVASLAAATATPPDRLVVASVLRGVRMYAGSVIVEVDVVRLPGDGVGDSPTIESEQFMFAFKTLMTTPSMLSTALSLDIAAADIVRKLKPRAALAAAIIGQASARKLHRRAATRVAAEAPAVLQRRPLQPLPRPLTPPALPPSLPQVDRPPSRQLPPSFERPRSRGLDLPPLTAPPVPTAPWATAPLPAQPPGTPSSAKLLPSMHQSASAPSLQPFDRPLLNEAARALGVPLTTTVSVSRTANSSFHNVRLRMLRTPHNGLGCGARE